MREEGLLLPPRSWHPRREGLPGGGDLWAVCGGHEAWPAARLIGLALFPGRGAGKPRQEVPRPAPSPGGSVGTDLSTNTE